MNSDTEDENSPTDGELSRKASEDNFLRRKRPRVTTEDEPVELVERKIACPDSVSTSRVDDGISRSFTCKFHANNRARAMQLAGRFVFKRRSTATRETSSLSTATRINRCRGLRGSSSLPNASTSSSFGCCISSWNARSCKSRPPLTN